VFIHGWGPSSKSPNNRNLRQPRRAQRVVSPGQLRGSRPCTEHAHLRARHRSAVPADPATSTESFPTRYPRPISTRGCASTTRHLHERGAWHALSRPRPRARCVRQRWCRTSARPQLDRRQPQQPATAVACRHVCLSVDGAIATTTSGQPEHQPTLQTHRASSSGSSAPTAPYAAQCDECGTDHDVDCRRPSVTALATF